MRACPRNDPESGIRAHPVAVDLLHEPDLRESNTNDWSGITVDEHGMSQVPGLFAVGDLVNSTADAI